MVVDVCISPRSGVVGSELLLAVVHVLCAVVFDGTDDKVTAQLYTERYEFLPQEHAGEWS